MLKFCEDLRSCRKLLFRDYFASSEASSAAFESTDSSEPCGHCDNVRRAVPSFAPSQLTQSLQCKRDMSTIKEIDVTMEVYRALRVLDQVHKADGKVTMAQIVDLVRGVGGASFVSGKGRGKRKSTVDIDAVAGSKVMLSRDETEAMIAQLYVGRYFKESYSSTAYNIITYLHPSGKALRYTRIQPKHASDTSFGETVKVWVRAGKGRASKGLSKGTATKRKSTAKPKAGSSGQSNNLSFSSKPAAKKRKASSNSDDEVGEPTWDQGDASDDGDDVGSDLDDFVVPDEEHDCGGGEESEDFEELRRLQDEENDYE